NQTDRGTIVTMNREDWNKLDELLGKEGFGGYYDFLELLKSYIRHWYENKFGTDKVEKIEWRIQNVKTLHQATCMLTAIELMEVKK
ncbi:MAG: hypothetical protein KAW47_11075, partial [Thermoplasmatales archaeon]|nr:hypothetical protein [Thermoplasmatales archaeon]